MGYTLAFSLAFGAVFCYIAGSSFLYQDVLGLTIAGNAWAVAGTVLVHSATAMSTAALLRWVSPRRLVHAGLGLMLLASATFLAVVSVDSLSLGVTLALVAVFFVGSGLVMPNATARALDQLPGSLGSGSAVLGTLQNTAAALAAPLVGLAGARVSLPLAGSMSCFALLAVAALALTRGNRTTQETRETAVNSEN
jgi:DHA1 family bicyclomycin/chloramphenicol resistance-like MFS transporter